MSRTPQQVEALAHFAINTYGHFDVWVNNAGVAGPYGATFDLSPEQFLSVLRTNMFGVYHGSRMAMRHFLPRKSGKLINILGAGSKKPAPNQNAYGSTKAWIRVFTLALAAETKHSGVGVFALQPGLMDTDLLTELVTFQEHEKRLREFHACAHPGSREETGSGRPQSALAGIFGHGWEDRSGCECGFKPELPAWFPARRPATPVAPANPPDRDECKNHPLGF